LRYFSEFFGRFAEETVQRLDRDTRGFEMARKPSLTGAR